RRERHRPDRPPARPAVQGSGRGRGRDGQAGGDRCRGGRGLPGRLRKSVPRGRGPGGGPQADGGPRHQKRVAEVGEGRRGGAAAARAHPGPACPDRRRPDVAVHRAGRAGAGAGGGDAVTVNADLLKRTLTHIETHPDTWNQAEYRCRTGLCFAGWAAVLAGGVWLSTDPDGVDRDVLVATDEEIARGDAIPVWDAYDDKR